MVTPLPIQVANLGMADSLILMVMALVVFGPRRLPQIGRQIGKLMYEFRKASNDFKFQMEEELRMSEEADRRKKEEAERARVAALAASSPTPAEVVVHVETTVEAQADIGAAEPSMPSVTEAASTPPAVTGSEPDPYPPPVPEAASVTSGVLPRIQVPRIGEQVAATSPYSMPEPSAAPSANPEPPPAEAESHSAAPSSESSTPPSETVSRHG